MRRPGDGESEYPKHGALSETLKCPPSPCSKRTDIPLVPFSRFTGPPNSTRLSTSQTTVRARDLSGRPDPQSKVTRNLVRPVVVFTRPPSFTVNGPVTNERRTSDCRVKQTWVSKVLVTKLLPTNPGLMYLCKSWRGP